MTSSHSDRHVRASASSHLGVHCWATTVYHLGRHLGYACSHSGRHVGPVLPLIWVASSLGELHIRNPQRGCRVSHLSILCGISHTFVSSAQEKHKVLFSHFGWTFWATTFSPSCRHFWAMASSHSVGHFGQRRSLRWLGIWASPSSHFGQTLGLLLSLIREGMFGLGLVSFGQTFWATPVSHSGRRVGSRLSSLWVDMCGL